jgi:hypothetical protein
MREKERERERPLQRRRLQTETAEAAFASSSLADALYRTSECTLQQPALSRFFFSLSRPSLPRSVRLVFSTLLLLSY